MMKMNVIMVTMTIMMVMVMVTEGNKIELTCKATPDFNLCVSLLKSDPKGVSADTSGLALIIVNKIKEVATKTMNEINVQYKKRPDLKQALDECSRSYKTMLSAGVPQATEALTKGNPKFGEKVMVDAGIGATRCEEGFKGKSPLTSLTKTMVTTSNVGKAIVKMLL